MHVLSPFTEPRAPRRSLRCTVTLTPLPRMRYIRFLKTPRIVYNQHYPGALANATVKCLITITSDLGDSFFPYTIDLQAQLCPSALDGKPLVCKRIKWTGADRYGLAIEVPLENTITAQDGRPRPWPSRLYVGVDKAPRPQLYDDLTNGCHCGILGAWSGPLDPDNGIQEAVKLVERQVAVQEGYCIRILEETGESIARHLWDAGFMLACHITRQALNCKFWDHTALILQPRAGKTRLQVLELGTGCGVVGIGIAQVIQNADLVLTDLPDAQEICTMNLANSRSRFASDTNVMFCPLKWEDDLPSKLNQWSNCQHCTQFDLIVASDCTYNPDSSPALVKTISNLMETSPQAKVMIAMKIRHEDENIFFSLMITAGFIQTHKQSDEFPDDGGEDEEVESCDIYIYEYGEKDKKAKVAPNEDCGLRLGSMPTLMIDSAEAAEAQCQSHLNGSNKRKR